MSVTVTPYFKPTSITGCRLWLDAQDNSVISLTSGYVSSVTDKALSTSFTSVGPTPANLTVASASINSYQSFYFNNSAGNYVGLSGNLAQLTTGTAIFIMKYISSQNGPWRGIFGWNDTSAVQSISFGTNLNGTGVAGPYVQNIGYNGSATATLTNNGLYIVTFTFTGTTTGVGYNGQISLTAGTVSSYSGSATSIGICNETNRTQMTAVYLGELIIYNTVLGSTDRQNVEAYLAQKWGLTSSLPSGHIGLLTKLYASSSQAIQVTPYTSVPYAFAPTQISGCQLWLDAADPAGTGVVPAAGVQSTWVDKSTNGWNATQATAGRQPSLVLNSLNGLPGFSFTNANNQSFATAAQASLNSISGLSVFAVLLPTWASGAAVANPSFFGFRLYNHGVTKINYYVHNNYSATDIYNGSGVFYHTGSVTTSAIGQNKVFIYSGTNNNGTDITYPNGSLTGDSVSVGFGSGTNLPIIVGGDNADGECWQGYIYEVIFYNTVLGSTDRQKVESYLGQKWGLKSSLAASHPGLITNYYLHQFMTTRGAITALAPAIFQLKYAVSGLQFHLDAGNLSSYPRSGSTWYDLAGSGLTTTLYNSPTYSSANGGSILFVPSSSQYGRTSAALPTLTRWTVEVWYYYTANNVGGLPCLISDIYNVSGGSSINFVLGNIRNNTVNLAALFYDLAYSSGWNGDSTYVFPSVGWYHVVGTYDGANIKLYINGSLNNTTATANTPTSGGLGIHLMRRWDSVGYEDFWGGYLSIVRIYNRALSLSEIGVNYNGSRQRFLLP